MKRTDTNKDYDLCFHVNFSNYPSDDIPICDSYDANFDDFFMFRYDDVFVDIL